MIPNGQFLTEKSNIYIQFYFRPQKQMKLKSHFIFNLFIPCIFTNRIKNYNNRRSKKISKKIHQKK